MKKGSSKGNAQPAKLIKEFLGGGLTVTIGGLPILITVGRGAEAPVRQTRPQAVTQPKPRRKVRRRKSKRLVAPDPRDVRGYLATQMEGSTLTALAQHFKVKRPLMKRMLRRMMDKKEITLFKGAFFNNKRLRQRRIPSKWEPARTAPEAVASFEPTEAAPPPPEPQPEPVAETPPPAPQAVPDQPEQEPEPLTYPERNAA